MEGWGANLGASGGVNAVLRQDRSHSAICWANPSLIDFFFDYLLVKKKKIQFRAYHLAFSVNHDNFDMTR